MRDAHARHKTCDSPDAAWLVTEHLPLIKQVLTVISDHTFNCCNNTASANSPNNKANRSVPPTVALQSLPVRQYVFCSNCNNSVINSAKHNFAYLTTEHIRYLVSNQISTVTACRNNFTFCTIQQFKLPIPVEPFVTISVTATVSL